jgi:hypothetical protein
VYCIPPSCLALTLTRTSRWTNFLAGPMPLPLSSSLQSQKRRRLLQAARHQSSNIYHTSQSHNSSSSERLTIHIALPGTPPYDTSTTRKYPLGILFNQRVSERTWIESCAFLLPISGGCLILFQTPASLLLRNQQPVLSNPHVPNANPDSL